MRTLWCVGVLCAALAACSGGKEHPPNYDPSALGGPGGSVGASGQTDNGDADTAEVSPPPITAAAFDPAEVYLVGTLAEGSAGRDAICHWSTPNSYVVGFPDYFDERTVEFRDGGLLYEATFENALRQFTIDAVSSLAPKDLKYPTEPARNDPILDTPPCLAIDAGPTAFHVGPTGRLLYRCPDGFWYEGGTKVYDKKENIVAVGNGDLVLVENFGLHVVDLATGVSTAVTSIDQSVLTYRAHESGFHVVVVSATTDDRPELWDVAADGTATRLGIYPLQPEGMRTNTWGADTDASKLAADDSLVQFGSDTTKSFIDVLVRRTLAGDSAVVYTEATDPNVKIHISALATGP